MDFEDTNRAFIQAFFARNVMTLEEAKPILAGIFSINEEKEVASEDITEEDLNSMISAANDALSPLDYLIRSTIDQESRRRYYALVNTTSDPLTQVATVHSSDEIGYIKRLLDEMFDVLNTERREAMCISGKDALNLVRTGRRETQGQNQEGDTQARFNITQHEAQVLLAQLVDEKWLDKSTKGFYSLSPRGLMELKTWLEDTYNDEDSNYKKIKSCEACKEIITTVCMVLKLHNWLTIGRVRDVLNETAPYVYTIFARRPSSECNVVEDVQTARRSGTVSIMWAREQ